MVSENLGSSFKGYFRSRYFQPGSGLFEMSQYKCPQISLYYPQMCNVCYAKFKTTEGWPKMQSPL